VLTRQDLVARRTIDITTYGRKTGLPRRIEIWWFHVQDRFVITGTPGRRDWLANLRSDPRLIIHVAGHDIHARAEEIADEELRRQVLTHRHTRWYSTQAELDRLVDAAPMIEVKLPGELSGGQG
jgi:deazaflavin-dependent oxidoreductase (nitroreductase family)